ncbi:hypothetical protein KP509_03G095000 [Ceratopteris richardii]|uniref:RNA-dependent RNA polymerase n=1 Tax=Ceratopteris richardii TaxID=49495 RepID=A0A8T2V9F5_CERRI|nr:hypothetical protein KP509_03G095000 [Ceratopteris richardii]
MADSTVCVFGLVSNVSAVELTSFLESLTRTKAVAQCKIQEERRSAGRFWALVQFKTGDDALLAIQLGQSGSLTFNGCRLKICQDTEGRSRGAVEEIIVNDVVLHAGCLTQSDVLHRLFKRRGCDVVVSGEKFSIIVYDTEHDSVYKLEWWISEIFELSRCKRKGRVHDIFPLFSCGGTSRFDTFILRVWLAPRIFRYKPDPDYYVCEGFFGFPLDRFSEPTWLRIGDFSSKASIGQSYVYCLQCSWQFSGNLEHLINKNPHLSVQHRKLSIHVGHHYCASVQSVPILGSAHLQQLPFEIIFSVNSLVQQGYLSGPGLDSSFLFCLRPSQEKSKSHILHVLENFKRLEDTCFEPEKWFQEESEKILGQSERDKLVHHQPDDKLLYVRKVLVTPTRVYFTGPEIELSNRVTRHFKEHIDDFLRISFVEEDHDTLYPSAFEVPEARCLEEDRGHMYKRVINILRDGISIGNKAFKFLAFSSSQLKEHSAWMFAANNKITADDIRNWMGDFFSIRNVAKCAARMGQSFSSSRSSWDVSRNEIEEIDDIWDMKRMYCFSDGVGKISASFATQVAKKCKFRTVPSLYQIRYGGFKGVVAVDIKSSYKLSLRPTMEKFPSSLTGLDILDHSHALPCYLNREIITILSTLGVEDTIFETMQKHQIWHMDAMLNDAAVALDVVQSYSGGHTANEIFEGMLLRGFHPTAEPFLKRMLHCFRASHLTNLRQKARIFVPKGRLLMGCMDETRTLNYGEVFISVSPIRKAYRIVEDGLRFGTVNGINNIDQTVAIVEGRVIVARNPCVHPGDIRVLRAVNVPSLHHLVDCVVFPQKGHRPHPSECSGGDLDGDKYFVSWDARLIPSEVCKPQDYQSESGQELQRPVNTQVRQIYSREPLNHEFSL